MKCPRCGFENPEGMKFCCKCSAPLKNRCPHCGFENPPRFKFCGECAAPLTGQTPAPQPPTLASRPQAPIHYTPPHLTERILAEQVQGVSEPVPIYEVLGVGPLRTKLQVAARIDRLPAKEKALLQTLAVMGKEFSLSLLKRVVDRPEEELYQLLSHLQGREFIYKLAHSS